MNFSEFIQKHTSEAMQVDFKNNFPNVYSILQEQKNKLEYADFESEISEVKAFSEKGVKDLKLILLRDFEQEKSTQFPDFLFKLRCYLEYKKLFEKIKNVKESTENKLTIKQIALKLVYENTNVTKENADEIIQKYNWESGHKLYLEYNKIYTRSNRIADPNKTKKVLENKIKLFESIIDLVADNKKQQVQDECNTLKAYLTKY